MRLSLDRITRAGLKEMLEEALMREARRSKPRHRRDEESREKDGADEEQDEEMEKLADLAEEQKGSPSPVEMDDEDMSDEAMEDIVAESDKGKKKPASKKKKKDS